MTKATGTVVVLNPTQSMSDEQLAHELVSLAEQAKAMGMKQVGETLRHAAARITQLSTPK